MSFRTGIFSALLFFVVTAFAQAPLQPTSSLARGLTPKIVAHVLMHGKQEQFNVGTSDAGNRYSIRFFTQREIYIVDVNQYDSGRKTLAIQYYLTNQHFAELEHPADTTANELIMGRPEIIIEEHLYDSGADGILEMYQQFSKKRGSSWLGFTRAERDLGKKAGVTQSLFDGGKMLQGNGKWRKATTKEAADARMQHLEHLRTIAKQFGIQFNQ